MDDEKTRATPAVYRGGRRGGIKGWWEQKHSTHEARENNRDPQTSSWVRKTSNILFYFHHILLSLAMQLEPSYHV